MSEFHVTLGTASFMLFMLVEALSNARFPARQGLPFRGHDKAALISLSCYYLKEKMMSRWLHGCKNGQIHITGHPE